MATLKTVAWWLAVIGALNWGLVGLGYFMGSDLNLVSMLLGSWPEVENLVYLLVGVSGLWLVWDKLMGTKA